LDPMLSQFNQFHTFTTQFLEDLFQYNIPFYS
jgi:hypothetical protein